MADSDFEVITVPELTTYLGPLVQVDDARLGFLVDLTNGVVMERWTTPVTDPALIPTGEGDRARGRRPARTEPAGPRVVDEVGR